MDIPLTGTRQPLSSGFQSEKKKRRYRIDFILVEQVLDTVRQNLRLTRIIAFSQYPRVENIGEVTGYSKRLNICKSCVCRSLPTRAERVITACSPIRKGIIRDVL